MSIPDLLPEVEHTIRQEGLLSPDEVLVVAVSGGPDSLALLHILWRMAPGWRWRLHVAHLDHGLRGAQSLREATMVATTAAHWGISATVEWRDVRAHAEATGEGIQAAARAVRYAFLAEIAFERQATAVVVAHQADDQAETLLHHLIRGAGPEGLAAMRPRLEWPAWRLLGGCADREIGPALVRPLLNIPRRHIEAYCAANDLYPTSDPSNESDRYTRTRIRQKVLPLLRELNPRIVESLGRTARLAAQQADDLQLLLEQHWPKLAQEQPGAIVFDRSVWDELLPSLRRLALRQAVARLRPGHALDAAQIDRALEAIATRRPRLDLGASLRLAVSRQTIKLSHLGSNQADGPLHAVRGNE
ncbi:MAG: hypothetical protein KatS3mg057_1733 [Herpetosiphonaceae bacterium]|nr:MAG: hypothetical protein KatS3mg057_1733 [Herpetosiphonaceae bacterium]